MSRYPLKCLSDMQVARETANMIHSVAHCTRTERSEILILQICFSARLSVKRIHCVCKYTSVYSSDKLHSAEFSIPVTVVTLQGAICLHCLETLDSF